MITKKDAIVGRRIKWQSLDLAIPPAYGRITEVKPDGEIKIKYDDGEDGNTYINSGVSTVYPA